MALSDRAAIDLAADTQKSNAAEIARLRRFVRYARGRQKLPWLPENVESEYRDIATKSASNWLDLVVRSTAQGLIVGHRIAPGWILTCRNTRAARYARPFRRWRTQSRPA